jgi:hypothetical protein
MDTKDKQKKDHTKSGLKKLGKAAMTIAGIIILILTGNKKK